MLIYLYHSRSECGISCSAPPSSQCFVQYIALECPTLIHGDSDPGEGRQLFSRFLLYVSLFLAFVVSLVFIFLWHGH